MTKLQAKTTAISLFFLFVSSSVFALTSTCQSFESTRIASHSVGLTWYESVVSNILEWETALVGPKTETQEHRYRNASVTALTLWHSLPYGRYSLTGTARVKIRELEKWEVFSASRCSISFSFSEPPKCESTDLIETGSTSYSHNVASLVRDGLGNAARSKFSGCTSGSISTSGTGLVLKNVEQCCEDTGKTDTGWIAAGTISLGVSGLNCSLKLYPPAAVGLATVEFAIGLGVSGTASASGSSRLCNTSSQAASLSGSANGTLSASVSLYTTINPQIAGVTGYGSAGISMRLSGTSLSDISFSTCLNSLKVGATVTVLYSSVDINHNFTIVDKYTCT